MDSETRYRMSSLVDNDAYLNDPVYHAQVCFIRGLVTRLEMILEDEGLPDDQVRRVMHSIVYGTPDGSDALLRLGQTGLDPVTKGAI